MEELLSRQHIEQIYVFDHNERGLFNAKQDMGAVSDQVEFVLGDVRERDKLDMVLPKVDSVIHAAALKHVPLGEQNPYEAVKTNVISTQNVLDGARKAGVTRVLGVSTDKAAQPTSVMGATKLLSERLLTAANGETDDLVCGSVRLGNVVGSSGSVARVFKKQIEKGGPVTVTHPEMSRFMFTPENAASFIVDAFEQLSGGEIRIPKMDSVRIMDLADTMIETMSPPDTDPADIQIEIIGTRPGERLHERLLTDTEARNTVELDDSFFIANQLGAGEELVSDGGAGLTTPYHSEEARFLSLDEVAELIADI
jgi:FlaA1/EpsC-like NDP-sugar epimerase